MFTLFTKKLVLSASALNSKACVEEHLDRTPKGAIRLHLKWWDTNFRTLKETKHYSMIEFLDALKVKYTTGNDAPRGGVTGDYIEITRKEARKCLQKLANLTQAYPRTKRQMALQSAYFN